MRRLSIATAHAFLLVYAATSSPSFDCVKMVFEEVREQRPDYQVCEEKKTILSILTLIKKKKNSIQKEKLLNKVYFIKFS